MTGLPRGAAFCAPRYTCSSLHPPAEHAAPSHSDAELVAQALARSARPKRAAPPYRGAAREESAAAEDPTRSPHSTSSSLRARSPGTQLRWLAWGDHTSHPPRSSPATPRPSLPTPTGGGGASAAKPTPHSSRASAAFARVAKSLRRLSAAKARAAYDLRIGRTPDASVGQRRQQQQQSASKRPTRAQSGSRRDHGRPPLRKSAGGRDAPAERGKKSSKRGMLRLGERLCDGARLLGERTLAPQQARYPTYPVRALMPTIGGPRRLADCRNYRRHRALEPAARRDR